MKPIRVLHCIFTAGVGGLEVGVVKLVNSITAAEIQQGVCAFTGPGGGNGSCFDGISNPHCRIFQLHRRRGNDVRLVGQLMRVIREFRPTVIHTRNWATYLEGAAAALMCSTPVLIHGEHGTPSPGRWRHKWAYRLLARRTRVVVTVSEALARLYHETCQSWATEVRTIHNGVDARRYVPPAEPAAAKAALGLPPSALVVGSVGRLELVKGFDVLLHAMARIVKDVPNALLLLVGDGSQRANLEATALQLGVARRVRFAGHRSEVVPYYQAMDVYVNASHSEGISNGILEALACGVPVVGTAVGGTPEILRKAGIGGRLVAPSNPEELAMVLVHFLQDSRRGTGYREAARQTACENFGLKQMVKRYENLYRETANA
jgi:sugar transferase (PEP-CTERM/EpsH1 system associated)